MLKDLADEDGFDFEEIDEEPIDKNDPMYQLDLKVCLPIYHT